ncbi:MAG: hypothetical protein LBP95_00195 [Deltaproteobacteria bacterium]|jgi:hypothetical protein|nr:hypothetical protein [Deltaproteobacteria bacterium]
MNSETGLSRTLACARLVSRSKSNSASQFFDQSPSSTPITVPMSSPFPPIRKNTVRIMAARTADAVRQDGKTIFPSLFSGLFKSIQFLGSSQI